MTAFFAYGLLRSHTENIFAPFITKNNPYKTQTNLCSKLINCNITDLYLYYIIQLRKCLTKGEKAKEYSLVEKNKATIK